jgi:hypothetical protein
MVSFDQKEEFNQWTEVLVNNHKAEARLQEEEKVNTGSIG